MNVSSQSFTRTTRLCHGESASELQSHPPVRLEEVDFYHSSDLWSIVLSKDGTLFISEVERAPKRLRLDNRIALTPPTSSSRDNDEDMHPCSESRSEDDENSTFGDADTHLSLSHTVATSTPISRPIPRPSPQVVRPSPQVVRPSPTPLVRPSPSPLVRPAQPVIAPFQPPRTSYRAGAMPHASQREQAVLSWDCSPELVEADSSRLLYVVDKIQSDIKAVTALCTQFTSWGQTYQLLPGQWAEHSGQIRSDWVRVQPSADCIRAFSARLLWNFFVDPTEWPATTELSAWCSQEASSMHWYSFDIKSTIRAGRRHYLETRCGIKLQLEGTASFMVRELPGFHENWQSGTGWARLSRAAVCGKVASRGEHVVIYGTLRLALDEEAVEGRLGEFDEKAAHVVRQILRARS